MSIYRVNSILVNPNTDPTPWINLTPFDPDLYL